MVWVRILQGVEEPALSLEDARLAGAELLPQLNTYKIDEVSIHNAGLSAEQLLAFTEGLALSSYQFIRHFSEPDKKAGSLHTIYLSGPEIQPEAVAELDNLVDAVCTARDLVNEPHGFLNAVQLADAVKTIGQASGFSVEILGKEKIETLKMGGLLAVNKASTVPPRFCVLEWQPASAKNAKPIVLIGKGVVYDTGGLSLKTPEGMEYMKCDMAGAASVIGALSAAARNQLPIHVVGLIPATDNAVNDAALSPGDVIRMYSGTTVEVVNTDAEGRLILADALHYAKKYEPELAIDLATLTGAAIRALGNQAICYMGTAPATTKKALEESGRCTYERLVELPLWREYGEELKSNIADLKNLGTGNAGMITAGKFLEHFTNYPWLHLDIAGPAYLRSANGYRTREGTGVGVRLLYHFLKNYASPEN
ncbi:MAG: leucyl aminopeptidase [Lewinellaceae bacterium]|nr:leucyl aminopeptidase [Lewinellaceae bacterium]